MACTHWQDYGCSQDKQNYLCTMAGFELEKYAIGHEMSKKDNANTTQSWSAFGKLVAPYNFAASLFCTAKSLLRTVLDHARWKLSQSCNCRIAFFVVEIWSQLGRTTLGPWQYNFNSGVPAIGKTTVAPKTNKTAFAYWLASNLKNMPLAMKCQRLTMQTRLKAGLHSENWSLPTTLQLHFFALQNLYSGPFQTMVAGSCPKVVIVA